MIEPKDIRGTPSRLKGWHGVHSLQVECEHRHFEAAVDNIVRNPGINSTVLLRADVYLEYTLKAGILCNTITPLDPSWLTASIDDIQPRLPTIDGWHIDHYLVRRNIPRNPHRDAVCNQSCVMYANNERPDERFLAYYPHCAIEEMPFYLPKASGVGILYSNDRTISVYYLDVPVAQLDPSDRLVRIALHLLNTAYKHSKGVQTGYKKRVQHDQIIARNAFQDRYIRLKQKYAPQLLESWIENTDPCKHVFEDLGIAAFLIELWERMYPTGHFDFVDVGCGNGLLVHILLMEGFSGKGIDIRERKSWNTYPEATRRALTTGIIMPRGLKSTLEEPSLVHIDKPSEQGKPTFIIGNHCDELTLWIPLLGAPFMVMPCCSHALDGRRTRFGGNKSQYQALVDKTLEISREVGWKPELEYLRIPSTRNAAIVGRVEGAPHRPLEDIIAGVDGDEWILCARKLLSTKSTH